MKKFPIFIQDNESSCGAFCIQMLLKYYQRVDSISHIKKKCRITKQGISVYGIIQVLKDYHIDAVAYQCDREHFSEVTYPAIVHLKKDNVLHYAILVSYDKGIYTLADPAVGFVSYSEEEFFALFTGVVICMKQVGYKESQGEDLSFYDFIAGHLKNHKVVIKKLCVKTLFVSLLSLMLSYYYRLMLDGLELYSFAFIVALTVGFLLVFAIKQYYDYFREQQVIDMKRDLDEDYVLKTIQNTLYLDYSLFKQDEQGVFVTKANYLLELSQFFLSTYQVLFIHSLFLLCLLCICLYIDWVLSLIVICFLGIIGGIVYYYQTKLIKVHKNYLEAHEGVHVGLSEFYQNFFQTLQFHIKKTMKNKIGYIYDDLFLEDVKKQNIMNRYSISIDTLTQLLLVFVLLYGGMMYQLHHQTIGEIIFCYMLISYMFDPLVSICGYLLLYKQTKQVFERYKSILPERVKKKKRIKKISSITFDNVDFSYGYGRLMFEHLNYRIDRSLVIKGDIGKGKTTFLKLISRQLEVVSGHIYFNDVASEDIDDVSFYSRVKYLSKTPVFFHDSLIYNLLLDRYDLYDEMIGLLKLFEMDELINHLHDKIDMQGSFLSSGQGQLVMLIRLLLSRPDVCILDEALSNVDQKRFDLVMNYLLAQDMIVLIVSHQTNMMKYDVDYVIIEEGNIEKEDKYGN